MKYSPESARIYAKMNAANLEASQAVMQYSHVSVEFIDAQVTDFNQWQDSACESAFVNLNGMQRASAGERAHAIADTSIWAQDLIARSGLDSSRTQRATEFKNEQLLTIIEKNSERDKAVAESRRRREENIMQSRNNGRQKTAESFKRTETMLTDDAVMRIGIRGLEAIVADRNVRIRSIISEREHTLSALITNETTSFEGVLRGKKTETDNSLKAFQAAFTAKIDALIRAQASEQTKNTGNSSRAHQQARGNTGHDSRQQSSATSGDRQNADDPRLQRVMGTTAGTRSACATVIANIDHHRAKGRSDTEIYRLLARHFHPDRTEHKNGEETFKVTSALYNPSTKTFNI